MSVPVSEKTGAIKAVVKAANVINLLADQGEPMSLTGMSAELGMSKSTLHGIVSTLVMMKFLGQDQETGYYRLGTRLFEIGVRMSGQWDVRRIAYPFILELVAELGETVHMAILDDFEVLYIDKHEASSSIRIVTDVGVRLPAHCTALGKALLSGLNERDFRYMVRRKGLKRYTEFTVTDPDRLWADMERIRGCGYAVDEQEYVEGLRCVAVPIRNHAGHIAAALSISGPVSRMRDEKVDRCKISLKKAGAAISARMGYEGVGQ